MIKLILFFIKIIMSDIEIPELWRIMSSNYENNIYKKPYLPNNNLKIYRKKIYDIYATKDGYMKFTLDKRFESKIIDKDEYDDAIENYNNYIKNINYSEIKNEIKQSKIRRYLSVNRLDTPKLLDKKDIEKNIKNLSDTDLKVLDIIYKFQKDIKENLTQEKLLTYNQIGFEIYNKDACGMAIGNSIRNLYNTFYPKTIYNNF